MEIVGSSERLVHHQTAYWLLCRQTAGMRNRAECKSYPASLLHWPLAGKPMTVTWKFETNHIKQETNSP
jgi:hypothetical protein